MRQIGATEIPIEDNVCLSALYSYSPIDYNRVMKFDSSPYIKPYVSSFSRVKEEREDFSNVQLPDTHEVRVMMEEFGALLFPDYEEINSIGMLEGVVSRHMEKASDILFKEASLAYAATGSGRDEAERKASEITSALLEELPHIREILKKDSEAGYNGDPAARSVSEIILTYPGFKAIMTHRIGHFLYKEGLPLIPRILNELIHSDTGIDIHPGATIGEYFFIDHGTGVVIGETTVIGDNVKIYQGVTLGALSFPKDGCGMLLRNQKRHPTIEDRVTIYANATVLGNITVSHDSTIGSNAWVKEDIPPHSRVIPEECSNNIRRAKD